ncbi:RING finger protein-like protein [Clathrospora elynae]|uniref:RBR-type E3 ubiquitin transferase n=1 Tax=Clathrospora elynae TaxID=706981 RepID=A0A6A5SBP8_9PLEO|nr:RING finger protein-like protein [Clathrospora elynae]
MAEYDHDDERAVELGTLQAIYPELVPGDCDSYSATLELLVTPVTPLPVTFEAGTLQAIYPELPGDNGLHEFHHLPYLPPLRLDITLPAAYPADAPPIVRVSTSPSWLPEDTRRTLTDEATSLWAAGEGATILFDYIVSLQEQACNAFGLAALTLPSPMRTELVTYSRRMEKELFDSETFECGVCLEWKKGSACYRMGRCSHVFCITCLQDYYTNCISEGDVNNVKCMSIECGKTARKGKKKDRLLSPKELLQIPLPHDQVDRYARIKRKKRIESDPNIVFCPRTWCQGAMRTDKYPKIEDLSQMDDCDSDAEDEGQAQQHGTHAESGPEKRGIGVRGMERLQICEDCNLAFCVVCLASWHGDLIRCQPRDTTQLTQEDQASLNFIMKNTSPCPYCSVPCQKSHGCNHMTCAQCKTHFCYLCAAWLNPDHPYAHFNDPKNQNCFQRLMDGAEGDMAHGDVEFGGPRGGEQMAAFWEGEALRLQMQEIDLETQ